MKIEIHVSLFPRKQSEKFIQFIYLFKYFSVRLKKQTQETSTDCSLITYFIFFLR